MEKVNIGKTTLAICNMGLGIALYVALSLCVQVPVFENYYICLGYIVMLVYCYSFGPLYGSMIGGIGCLLYCVLTNGLRGMPGWMLGNIFLGIVLGLWFKQIKKTKRFKVLFHVLSVIVIIAATAGAMLGIKSLVECILYAQPFLVRGAKNIYAFVSDAIVLVVSLPIALRMNKFLKENE